MQDEPVGTREVADRYVVGSVLGRGGMATVYQAWDRRLGREVAIKLLAPALASDRGVRRRFEIEANAAARISHPNVVTIFDTNDTDCDPFIVMECLSGMTIADELRSGPLPLARVREIASDVLAGLGAAHELGVIHRDIKPSNLLVADDASIKIADFGIAKSVEAVDHTATGEMLGSVAYIAPERLEGRTATLQSDLYSLGVVLYEAAAGKKPFGGDTPAAVAHAIVATKPIPLRDQRRDVDEQTASAIGRAMAKNPEDRFASTAEMAALLASTELLDATLPVARVGSIDAPTEAVDTFAADAEGETRRLLVDGSNATPSRRRVPRLAVVIAVVALVLGAGLALSRTSSGTGYLPVRPAATVPSAPPGRSVTPAQKPLPGPLDHSLKQLEQDVRG